MLRLWTAFQTYVWNEEEGASMVEYALLVALIAVVAIVAIGIVGNNVNSTFEEVGNQMGGVTPTTG